MDEEHSASGDPIYRHPPRNEEWVPPDMEDSSLEAISSHIERHIGKIDMVWHEIMSDLVHIDVHQVAPTKDRPFWTLITSGMSDLPMTVPEGMADRRFCEVMLCLPRDWKTSAEDFKDERYYWPLRWLKILARFPHEYKTWFGEGHSIPHGDPPSPIHDSVPFVGVMLSRPKTVSVDFWSLPVRADKTVQFYSVLPLHPAEIELKLQEGAAALEELLERRKVTEVVDLGRRAVTRWEWWKLR